MTKIIYDAASRVVNKFGGFIFERTPWFEFRVSVRELEWFEFRHLELELEF